jgi:hypothetical protein
MKTKQKEVGIAILKANKIRNEYYQNILLYGWIEIS